MIDLIPTGWTSIENKFDPRKNVNLLDKSGRTWVWQAVTSEDFNFEFWNPSDKICWEYPSEVKDGSTPNDWNSIRIPWKGLIGVNLIDKMGRKSYWSECDYEHIIEKWAYPNYNPPGFWFAIIGWQHPIPLTKIYGI